MQAIHLTPTEWRVMQVLDGGPASYEELVKGALRLPWVDRHAKYCIREHVKNLRRKGVNVHRHPPRDTGWCACGVALEEDAG